jgi:hypothetical protein
MLTYSSKAWTACKREESRIMAAEIKFMKKTACYTLLDYKMYLDIMKKLNAKSVMEFRETYRANFKNHVLQIPRSRIPFQIFCYQPDG